jgi:hypothetical protein
MDNKQFWRQCCILLCVCYPYIRIKDYNDLRLFKDIVLER